MVVLLHQPAQEHPHQQQHCQGQGRRQQSHHHQSPLQGIIGEEIGGIVLGSYQKATINLVDFTEQKYEYLPKLESSLEI